MTNNRQERENKEVVLLSQIESKMDCLTKVFYVGVSLSEDIPWGFGNIWTTLNYLFNKKITKQIDSNQFMNVWQRPKPWKIFFLSSRIVTQRLHLSYENISYGLRNSLEFWKWKILAVSLNRTLFELEEIFRRWEISDVLCEKIEILNRTKYIHKKRGKFAWRHLLFFNVSWFLAQS